MTLSRLMMHDIVIQLKAFTIRECLIIYTICTVEKYNKYCIIFVIIDM